MQLDHVLILEHKIPAHHHTIVLAFSPELCVFQLFGKVLVDRISEKIVRRDAFGGNTRNS